MRGKRPITLHGLREARAATGPWKFCLTFEHIRGPGDNTGREGRVFLAPSDLVTLLGAVPASQIGEEHWEAYKAALDLIGTITSQMEQS